MNLNNVALIINQLQKPGFMGFMCELRVLRILILGGPSNADS